MSRRVGILALLVFQAFWLNVVLPGHTRGVITLPGFEPAADSCHADGGPAARGCCPGPSKSAGSQAPKPGDGRAAHCAVCFFAARLTLPATIDLTPAPLELLELAEAPRIPRVVSIERLPTYLGRGPPLV